MAGTIEGGKKAAAKNKELYGEGFYAEIGGKGGRKGRTGGFAARVPCSCDEIAYVHYKANCAGAKGGRISRRSK